MQGESDLDVDVLRKFDRPGPRYTSYPPAPLFSEKFTADDFLAEVGRTNTNGDTDLSLYLHFPFCAKLCYFCGCNMKVSNDREAIATYNGFIKREIENLIPHINPTRKVTQMHWGGGTPSHLDPDEIRDVGRFLFDKFKFAEDCEASIEIDPRNLTRDHMKAFREIGFNRMSMGVQDFNPQVQEAVNREQSEEITREALGWAREFGFRSINIDLIYGLPFQRVNTFIDSVERVVDMSPDRVAVFNYAHVPWLKKHQSIIKTETLPDIDERLKILQSTITTLTAAGYQYIGMDHFAKTDDELAVAQREGTLYRNFQGYSTKAGCDLYAFGISAISQFENIYCQNAKTFEEYYAAVEATRPPVKVGYRMTDDDKIRRDVIMELMCHLQIDIPAIEKKHGIVFMEYFPRISENLDVFVREGLLEIDAVRISVKGDGKLVLRNIAMVFDAYIEQMIKEKPIFSRTV
jgi:oxygen-independent coproporphyrinogen III oxidase